MTLSSPTMETDHLTENWNITKSQSLCNEAEDSIILNTWKENYQDLSSWCMGTLQDHCIVPVGELKSTESSGMKIEEKYTSVEEGGVKELMSVSGESLINVGGGITGNYQQPILPLIDEKLLIGGPIEGPEPWLDIPKSSIALQTDEWIKFADSNELVEPVQQVSVIEKTDTKHADQQGNWDVIKIFSNADSDDFDLLSYLCDDSMPSSENISSYSTNSTPVLTSYDKTKSKSVKMKGRTKCQKTRKESEKSTSSTFAPLDIVDPEHEPSSSKVSTKLVRHAITKMNKKKIPMNSRRKCRYERDSDRSSNLNYRESREKNNEASRKSRMNKKAKESEMISRAVGLEKDNQVLKMKVAELEKTVNSLRSAILESVLKRRV